MTSTTTFTVFMHPDLVDELDDQLSPTDGIAALDEVFGELPLKHQPRQSSRIPCRRRKSLKLYHGRFGWLDIGFSYVQIGNELHIVRLWHDVDWAKPDRSEVDCVIGERTV